MAAGVILTNFGWGELADFFRLLQPPLRAAAHSCAVLRQLLLL
jgi:hypothetical protein